MAKLLDLTVYGPGHIANDLSVDSSVYAKAFVTSGGTNAQVVRGDGTLANISGLSVNYAASAGNADTVDNYHESDFFRYRGSLYQKHNYDANTLGIGEYAFRSAAYGSVGSGANHVNALNENSTIQVFKWLQMSAVAWSDSMSYRLNWAGETNTQRPNGWSPWITFVSSSNYTDYVNTTNFPGLHKVGTVTSVTVTGANGLSGSGTVTSSGTITLSNSGVRSTTINGNYLRVNTNGTNVDLTIPYASNADTLDGYHYSSFAWASHGHDEITNSGKFTAISGTTLGNTNTLRLNQVYANGYPVSYGNVLRIGGTGYGELLCEWTGTESGTLGRLYYRSKRDVESTPWSSWGTIAYTSDIPTVTNYYWANVKVSATSSESTTPTFGNTTIKGIITSYPNASAASNQTYTWAGGGYYATDSPNLRLYGDNTYGISTIEFLSSKGSTSINVPSDCGFIQFLPYGISAQTAAGTAPTLNSSGELNRLVIGVNNDATDQLWLQTPSADGLRHIVGTGNYRVLSSYNTYVSSNKGYINGSEITYTNSAGNADTTDGVHIEWGGSISNADTTWICAWNADGTKIKALQKSTVSVNYATSAGSAGNSDTVDDLHASDFVRAYGTVSTDKSLDSDWGQSMITFDPVCGGTYPESNPNVTLLNLGNNYARRKQLAFTYNNDNIYYRRRVDSSWKSWVRLALAGESYTKSDADARFVNVTGDTMTNHLYITMNGQTLTLGSYNSTWGHIQTTASSFWFNTSASFDGHVAPYANNTYTSGYADNRWSNVYSVLGNFSGAVSFANGTWNPVGDDSAIGDCNLAGLLGLKSLNNNLPGIAFYNSSGTNIGKLLSDNSVLKWNGNTIWHAGNDGTGSGLDADLLDGLHQSSFTREYKFSMSDYGRYVIGLLKLDSYDDSRKAFGRIYLARTNTLYTTAYIDYCVGTAYSSYNMRGTIICYGRSYSPCTFTYNGILYGGIILATSDAQEIAFVQKYNSYGIEPFVVHYYDTRNGVTHAEVNNSLSTSTKVEINNNIYGYLNGNISGSAASVRDTGNGTAITFSYSTGGFSSTPSWIGAWNGYNLTYVSPSVLSVNYASSAGNADTVDSQHFTYSNSSNSPTYLWGTNSSGSNFLAHRASISVNYASSAGNADTLDGSHSSAFATAGHTHSLGNKNAADLSSTYPSGISVGGIYGNGYPFNYGATITACGNGGYFQIAGQWNEAVSSTSDYDKATEMYIRGRRDSYDVWTTWSRVITNRNYTAYTVTKTGGGASGTWGINITGSAGNADTLDGYHHSSFAKSENGVYPVREFTKSLAPTTSWSDTGITTNDFADGEGAYMLFLNPNHSNGNDGWVPRYAGIFVNMSGTNGSETEEIILQAASHASYKRLFLRFINTANTLGYRKLQIRASSNYTSSYSMIFKIRRII